MDLQKYADFNMIFFVDCKKSTATETLDVHLASVRWRGLMNYRSQESEI